MNPKSWTQKFLLLPCLQSKTSFEKRFSFLKKEWKWNHSPQSQASGLTLIQQTFYCFYKGAQNEFLKQFSFRAKKTGNTQINKSLKNLICQQWDSRPEKSWFLLLNTFLKKIAANCPFPQTHRELLIPFGTQWVAHRAELKLRP